MSCTCMVVLRAIHLPQQPLLLLLEAEELLQLLDLELFLHVFLPLPQLHIILDISDLAATHGPILV